MLYAITDRSLFQTHEATACLIEQAAIWTANGVDIVQLREKDLPGRDQVGLARAMLAAIRSVPHSKARLLINGRADVALAAGADGVHLPSGRDSLTPQQVQDIFESAQRARPIVSISCHTLPEVEVGRGQLVDCILFGPVFEKRILTEKPLPGSGLALLRQACRVAAPVPVVALGGVTAANAAECLQAGAAGIAAIRLLHSPASQWTHLAR